METLKKEMKQCLEDNILRYWIDKVTDKEHGGYYGRVDGHDKVHPEAEKGAILNGRILWAFSAAYRVMKTRNISTQPHEPRTMSSITSSTRVRWRVLEPRL